MKEIRDRRELGEDFVVKLIPEPENVADSRAIRFGVNIDGTWRTIGYVVREIVEEIHSAIETNSIVSTEFAWVKYKLWKKAPGYYVAVTITNKLSVASEEVGHASSRVHRSRPPVVFAYTVLKWLYWNSVFPCS